MAGWVVGDGCILFVLSCATIGPYYSVAFFEDGGKNRKDKGVARRNVDDG